MDLRSLQACISKMDHEICAKVDENYLQCQASKQDFSHQDARKDPPAQEKERHLPNCSTEKDPEAQVNDNNLLARIREKWAAKQGSASISASNDDLSNSGDTVSLNIDSSGDIYKKDKLHPASSTPAGKVHLASSASNALRDGVNMTSSRGCDVRPKDRFRPSLSIDDTQKNSRQNMFSSKRADERFPSKQYDKANVRDNDQSWQCRQKARSMPMNATATSEASSKVNDFECEVFEEGHESANGKWKSCKKYPGHKDFIPVNEFTIQHLPKAYRTNTFYKGFKSVARVTVRLRVKYKSKDRPDGYLFSDYRGTRLSHTGSGVIFSRFFSEKIKGKEVLDNLTDIGTEDSDPKGAWADMYAGRKRRKHETTKYLVKNLLKSKDKDGKIGNILKYIMKPDVREAGGTKGYLKFVCDLYDNPLANVDSDDEDYLPFGETDSDDERLPGDLNDSLFLFGLNEKESASGRNKTDGSHQAGEDEYDKIFDEFLNLAPFGEIDDTGFSDSDADEDIDDYVDDHNTGTGTDDDDDEDDDEDDENELLDSLYEQDDNDLKEPLEDDNTFGVVSPCCCQDCKKSNSPEPKGYYVNVLTARHVVFDKEEAENTIVELFCDDDSESGKRTLFGVDVHLYYHAGDMVIVMCVTHDMKLILKLQRLVKNMMENTARMKYKKETPMAFICSHPHGNFKHVTVGEWTQRNIHRRPDGLPPYWTSYFYNTPTCPGSSGGPVIILGHRGGMMMLDTLIHLHHGHHEKEINKSSRFISIGDEMEHFAPRGKKERKEKKEADNKRKIDTIVNLLGHMF